MTDLEREDRLGVSLTDIEIRIQTKEAGRRKGMAEVLKEAGEKLKDQLNLYGGRVRLVKGGKRGNELILKYQILREHKLTQEEERKNPYYRY